jgi:hypothetical protein
MRNAEARRRVRTGCLACRKRRRKCELCPSPVVPPADQIGDELKPRCDNCAKRDARCQYPGFANASVHEFAVRQDTRRAKGHGINDDHSPTSTSLSGGSYHSSCGAPTAANARYRPAPPQRSQTLPVALHQVNLSRTSPQVHDHIESNVVRPTPDDVSSLATEQHTRSSLADFALAPPQHTISASNPGTDEIDLICHFRYEVAPWLDAFTCHDFFSVKLFATARQYRSVMAAVLAVSSRHRVGTSNGSEELCRRYETEAESLVLYQPDHVQSAVRHLMLLCTVLCCPNTTSVLAALQQFLASTTTGPTEEPCWSFFIRLGTS